MNAQNFVWIIRSNPKSDNEIRTVRHSRVYVMWDIMYVSEQQYVALVDATRRL